MAAPNKKVSMQAIADRLKISKSAVSIALGDRTGVSDELRSQVLHTAQEMGYVWKRPVMAISENQKRANILVLIPEYISTDTFFYNEIYWSIEREAKNRGFNAILTSVNRQVEVQLELPSICASIRFCGIMIVGIFQTPYVAMLSRLNMPLLSVDHFYDGMPLDAVVTANLEGAYDVVRYLIDCGHRKIGYIGSIEVTASLFERWCGFQKAMRQNGLEVDMDHCILETTPLGDLLGDADEIGQCLGKMKSFPTAWFCGGDRIAVALINALGRKGLRVPEDISVAGFDDTQAAGLVIPALTTFRVKRELMGVVAVDTLLDRLQEPGEKLKTSIYGELVKRNSVKVIS